MDRLRGKIAVVTGSSSGNGRAIALALAREGAALVCSDIRKPALEGGYESDIKVDTDDLIREEGGQAEYLQADTRRAEEIQALVDRAVAAHGRLDVMVNNAGVFTDLHTIVDETEEQYDFTMDVNVKGVWLCCKAGIPAMLRSGGGSIINVASFVAHLGAATPQLAYTTSKGAVLAMTREIAVIHAREGIRANALCPGPVLTPLLAKYLADETARQRRLVHIPMGRFGEAEEMVHGALFLASDESSFMTGQSLIIDGGITAAYTTPE